MATYLLLRSNKESGPHSVDDLRQMGLKPYDLVWIQGKSAAWRYPSEVDELKPFAPVIEEQPYDRFYKKEQPQSSHPSQVSASADQTKSSYQQSSEISHNTQQPIKPEHEKYVPKGSVFVTLPGQKTAVVPAQPEKTTPQPLPVREPAPVEQTISVSENPEAAQIKYSQPLDEIKEMYVKTLQERKQKIARKDFWIQSLKKAAVILALVAVGVIAGMVINSNGNSTDKTAAEQTHLLKPDISSQVVADDPAVAGNTQNDDQPMQESTLEEPTLPLQMPTRPITIETARGKAIVHVPVTQNREEPPVVTEADPALTYTPRSVMLDAATGERSKTVRNSNTAGSSTSRSKENQAPTASRVSSLGGLVAVESNEYKKVAFGGIRDLKLTLTNDSKYLLDNVIVELQYLKPSEQPLRTENITFRSIEPNSAATIKLPDTNRGIKVTYRIINVQSRQMDESLAGVRE